MNNIDKKSSALIANGQVTEAGQQQPQILLNDEGPYQNTVDQQANNKEISKQILDKLRALQQKGGSVLADFLKKNPRDYREYYAELGIDD